MEATPGVPRVLRRGGARDTLDDALANVNEAFGFSARKRTQTWASLDMENAVAYGLVQLVRYLEYAVRALYLVALKLIEKLSYASHILAENAAYGSYSDLNLMKPKKLLTVIG